MAGEPAPGSPGPEAQPAGAPGGVRRGSRLRAFSRVLFGRQGSVRRPIVFVLIAAIISSLVSPAFLSVANWRVLLTSSSFLVILAVGEAFVVMVGGIDLGVESMLAAAGMLAAWMYVLQGLPTALTVIGTLAFGAAVGALAGLLVSRARVPSFIVTLGTYWGFRGVALLFNGGNYISPDAAQPPRPFGFEGLAGNILGFPALIIVMVAVVAVAQVVLSYTPLGTWIKASGSSEEAARAVGVRTGLIKVLVFVISSTLAALAGLMITAWQHSIYPLTGQGFSLQAIAGVILGGIPFTGGRGSIVGAALGALVIGIINDMIVLIGLPAQYEYIFVAVVLVLAGLQTRGQQFVK
jgi:ribose/xylose/arabinose/galactoside ABC-type transport system permease subunit